MNKRIEQEVNKTMESLDGLERANPRSFFYGRLENRMKQSAGKETFFSWDLSLKIAASLIIIALNAYVVVSSFQSDEQDEIEYLVEEYSVSSSIYDLTEE